jgi:hypothetical protein
MRKKQKKPSPINKSKELQIPQTLWQAFFQSIYGWNPTWKFPVLILVTALAILFLIWTTFPEKIKTEIISDLWNKKESQRKSSEQSSKNNTNTSDLSEQKVTVVFKLPDDSSPVALAIKDEEGQTLFEIEISPGTHQTFELPPGNYRYILTPILKMFKAQLKREYFFNVRQGEPKFIELPAYDTFGRQK